MTKTGEYYYDFFRSYGEAIFGKSPSNWHPHIYAVLLHILAEPFGLYFFSICQIMLWSGAVCCAVSILYKAKIHYSVCIGLSLFYAVVPSYAWFSVTLNADMISFPLFLIFVSLYYLALTDKNYFTSKVNIISFSVVSALLILFRTQQLPVVGACFLVILIKFLIRKYKKELLIRALSSVLIIFVLYGAWSLYCDKQNVAKAGDMETLALPIQMVGALYANGAHLKLNEKKVYETINSKEDWKSKYQPQNSDPLRGFNRMLPVDKTIFFKAVLNSCSRNKKICLNAWWDLHHRLFTNNKENYWWYNGGIIAGRSYETIRPMFSYFGCKGAGDSKKTYSEKIEICYEELPNMQKKYSLEQFRKFLVPFEYKYYYQTPFGRNVYQKYTDFLFGYNYKTDINTVYNKIWTNFAIPFWLSSLLLLICLFRIRKNLRSLMLLLPITIYYLTLFIFLTTTCIYRYVFPVVMILPFVTALIIKNSFFAHNNTIKLNAKRIF